LPSAAGWAITYRCRNASPLVDTASFMFAMLSETASSHLR
jgi:hypothetical protein